MNLKSTYKERKMNKINQVIYCIIDDVRSSHFFDFIERGLLPNFKKLMDTGLYSKSCITDFPSVTYPTQATQITGTYTGDYRYELCHGIPVYNWMGRYYSPPILRSYGAPGSDELIQAYKLNSDLRDKCRTFLEMTGEGNHASITQYISRGTDYMFPESKIQLAFYYELMLHSRNQKKMMARANTMGVKKLLDTFKRPSKYFESNEAPIGSNLWFMSSDVLMHLHGYDSLMYKLNLLHIDKVMGILFEGLEKMGYLDDTVIAITADHGNYKAERVGNIEPFYQKTGLTPYQPNKKYRGNVNIAEFGSLGMFYFKGKERTAAKYGWSIPSSEELRSYGPKKINVYQELFKIEGCELMYFPDDENTHNKGKINLRRKNKGNGNIIDNFIEYRGTGEGYQTRLICEDEKDIFHYSEDEKASKLLDGAFHSIDEWLEGTHHLDYPLYPDLIPRHFKNPRSADIIISTGGEVIYNIKHGKKENDHVYAHDIGHRKSACVPLLIGGSSEVPHVEVPFCKTTDIVPTLLKMMGKKPHKSVVGKSLI